MTVMTKNSKWFTLGRYLYPFFCTVQYSFHLLKKEVEQFDLIQFALTWRFPLRVPSSWKSNWELNFL